MNFKNCIIYPIFILETVKCFERVFINRLKPTWASSCRCSSSCTACSKPLWCAETEMNDAISKQTQLEYYRRQVRRLQPQLTLATVSSFLLIFSYDFCWSFCSKCNNILEATASTKRASDVPALPPPRTPRAQAVSCRTYKAFFKLPLISHPSPST